MPRAASPRKPNRPRDPGADGPDDGLPSQSPEPAPAEATPGEAAKSPVATQSPEHAAPRQHRGRPPKKREPAEAHSKSGPIARARDLQVPTKPVEPGEEDAAPAPRADGKPAVTINIAKLQAMNMTELNAMAKEMSIENFGTMRKHEVIFHILQKNAERSGILFSEGVLEVLPEGFGFLRSQSFNYLPCPEDIYVSPSQIRRFDLQTGNLVAGQIRPPKEKSTRKTPTRPRTRPTSTTSPRSSRTGASSSRPAARNSPRASWTWSVPSARAPAA